MRTDDLGASMTACGGKRCGVARRTPLEFPVGGAAATTIPRSDRDDLRRYRLAVQEFTGIDPMRILMTSVLIR